MVLCPFQALLWAPFTEGLQRAKPSMWFQQLAACPSHQSCSQPGRGPAGQLSRQWREPAFPASSNLCLEGQANAGKAFQVKRGGSRGIELYVMSEMSFCSSWGTCYMASELLLKRLTLVTQGPCVKTHVETHLIKVSSCISWTKFVSFESWEKKDGWMVNYAHLSKSRWILKVLMLSSLGYVFIFAVAARKPGFLFVA